jgi:CheY-like chemotaxis protein/HPt (histidine-containing phosphotransfer) domain-containing protein
VASRREADEALRAPGAAYDVVVAEWAPGAERDLGAALGDGARAPLPVVALVDPALNRSDDAALRGCRARLNRPLRPTRLVAALGQALGIGGAAAAPAREPEPPLPTCVASGPRLRVLLAEDNAVNQKVALKILERLGYRADVAASGPEAIDAVGRRPYDVVWMDVQMPDMDGIEATRRIRDRLPPERQPYIIALTAYALEHDRQSCLAAGMDDYLSKPVQVDEVMAALLRHQPRQKAGTPAAPAPGAVPAARDPSPPPGAALGDTVRERLRDGLGLTDPAAIAEIIDAFVADGDAHIAALRAAIPRGDAAAARLALHSLKGGSRNLGAAALADCCERLEGKASEPGLADLAEHLPALEAEWAATRAGLEEVGSGGEVTPNALLLPEMPPAARQ